MNKLAGLNSTKEIGDWYDNKYREMGGAWNTPPEDCQKHINIIKGFLPEYDMFELLDLGCGGGHFISEAAKHFECTGIEASVVGIEECKKRVPEATFLEMDIEQMTFPDNSFDIVTSIGTLEHVINIPLAVSECYRVLSEGGIFYVYAPNHLWLHEDQPQETRMERDEWEKILTDAGFTCQYFEQVGDNNIYVATKN